MEVQVSVSDGTFGIGELAELTGVPVRTIRFYCDEGILPARRSGGGHRRFDRDAVERLRLVRRLRVLGLGLPAIAGVLTGERSMAEAVAIERAGLDARMAALAWRRASLRAVELADPAERAARLDLLAAVEDGRAARDALAAFWRGLILAPLPPWLAEGFVEMSVPEPPADPTPEQVVAYAGMVALTADGALRRRLHARGRINMRAIADEETLMVGVGSACELAAPEVLAGAPPRPGPALDRFVETHALVRGGADTLEFRRRLLGDLAEDQDPRIVRYWDLSREVTGKPASLGTLHIWLVRALAAAVGEGAQARPVRGQG